MKNGVEHRKIDKHTRVEVTNMGFYYLIMLAIGLYLVIRAGILIFQQQTINNKRIIITGITGILLTILSMFLLTPESSEIIAKLLRWE